MQELKGIPVKQIDNIPYVLGAEAIKEVFERFGVKKSKRAVYKFLSKTTWKRRVKENGRSMIAVPIYEIKRWVEKNYPMAQESEEKSYISRNFGVIDGFQKIIDELTVKVSEGSEEVPEIFRGRDDERRMEEGENVNGSLVRLFRDLISVLVGHPPSSFDERTLDLIRDAVVFIYAYIENISKLRSIEKSL